MQARLTADELIARLSLEPHPEGGWYRQTFSDPATDGDGRARSTAIYYLLRAGEASAKHRVDAVEIWHWYAGDPLEVTVDGMPHRLGPDVAGGERPQVIVPAGAWQSARPLGAWTLVGCTVAPGFRFEGFELA